MLHTDNPEETLQTVNALAKIIYAPTLVMTDMGRMLFRYSWDPAARRSP